MFDLYVKGGFLKHVREEAFCRCDVLVSNLNSVISRCQCGIYHVRVHGTTLHLTAPQFHETARLFKFALGMLVGQWDASSLLGSVSKNKEVQYRG